MKQRIMKSSLNLVLSALVCWIFTLSARADHAYSNAVMALAPVAYWPLDETNEPPPAGNLATNLGTSGSAYDGYYGSGVATDVPGALVADPDTAASFNGSSGYLDIPYGPVATIGAPFTAEAWLNAEGNSGTYCALSAGQFGSPRAGWLIYNVGSGWSFRLYNLNGTATSLNLTGGTIDANWHHIVAVFDGTNGRLYQDGVLVAGPTAATGYVPNPSTDLTIGARSDGGFVFAGEIDEVAIYTNVLSSTDVQAHYNNGTSTSPSQTYASLILADKPAFYYRLDETISSPSSSVVATNYGSLGATVDGTYLAGTIPGTAGPAGKGFGSVSYGTTFVPAGGGYVDCTTDPGLDITTNITVAAWFKGAPADNRFQSFVGRSDNSWRADLDGNGVAHFADGPNPDAVGQKFVNDGKWHFFTGVYDGSAVYVYIDGVLDQTNVATAAVSGDPSADTVIGGVGDYIPGRLFKGSVSQVAVFAGSLSASQIQTLYYAGELLPAITQNPKNLIVGLGLSGSLTTVASGNPTLVYRWYNGTNLVTDVTGKISGSSTPTLTFSDIQLASAGNYTVVVSNSFGSVTSAVAVVTVTPLPSVVVQPLTNTLVYAGNLVPLSATVIGAPPLTYQWYNGTTPIAGATSTNLPLTAVAGTNLYHLIVTNSYGSVTSSVAKVVAQTFVAPASGLVVNFDSVANGNTALNFVGPGAYNDPGNDVWNAIPGSGVSTGLATNSVGGLTLVSATFIYGFNNTAGVGAGGVQNNGDPAWLLSTEDAVNGGNPGVGDAANPEGLVTISDLPQGSYDLYLYADNYDGTRGSIFSVAPANGGGADQGLNATTAQQQGSNGGDSTVFTEGDDYVLFTNVVADATGTIVITYVPNDNVPSGLTGEAPFNGVQAVLTVTPNILSIKLSGSNVIVSWSVPGGTLQSATSLTGPFTDITGATSPYTTPVTGAGQFFRVH
jgi:hypothetical protein